MMLYERTGEERFLQFAEHIVGSSEANEGLRLLSAMLAGEDVSGPGLGKAYQLMANLLGYGELYRPHRRRQVPGSGAQGLGQHPRRAHL